MLKEKTKKNIEKTIFSNIKFDVGITILSRICAFVLIVLLARLLTPSLFGIYSLVIAICFSLMVFADVGVSMTIMRYMADALGKNDNKMAKSYFWYLLKIGTLLMSGISLLVYVFAEPLSVHVFQKPLLVQPLQLVSLYILTFAILGMFKAVFKADQKFKYSSVTIAVYELTRIILAPSLVLLGYSVFGAVAGLIGATVISLLIASHFLVKRYGYLFKKNGSKIDKRRVLKYLGFLLVTSMSGVFFLYIDSIMLGALMPAKYLGYYRVAISIVATMAALFMVSDVLLPAFTQLKGGMVKSAFQKSFKYLVMITMPCAFGLPFIAMPFVVLIFGTAYLPALIPLMVVSFLIIDWSAASFYNAVFNAKEMPNYPAYILIVSCVLNVILNYILIINFGLIGAAIATTASRFFNLFLLGIVAKIKLGITPMFSSVAKPLFACLAMVSVLYFIPTTTLLSAVTNIIIGIGIYLAVMFLTKGIKMDDIRYFRGLIKREATQ